MADCDFCLKKDVAYTQKVSAYTAITESARKNLGQGMRKYRTRTVEPQHHVYQVCDKCLDKYQLIRRIVWGAAAVLAVGVSFLAMDDTRVDFWTILVCGWLPLFAGAYWVNKEIVSIEAKIKDLAVKDRQKTDYKNSPALLMDLDPEFSHLQKNVSVVGLSRKEYDELMEKLSGK